MSYGALDSCGDGSERGHPHKKQGSGLLEWSQQKAELILPSGAFQSLTVFSKLRLVMSAVVALGLNGVLLSAVTQTVAL